MSLGGNLYALVVVDDFSRFTWTLFLHSKKEAYPEFKKLVKRLQNTCCSNIRVIRSDLGGEFQNEKFISFCNKLGVEPSGVHVLKNPNLLKDVEASAMLDVAVLV